MIRGHRGLSNKQIALRSDSGAAGLKIEQSLTGVTCARLRAPWQRRGLPEPRSETYLASEAVEVAETGPGSQSCVSEKLPTKSKDAICASIWIRHDGRRWLTVVYEDDDGAS
jgi:hypothetical protein